MRGAAALLLLLLCCPVAADEIKQFGFGRDLDHDKRPDLWPHIQPDRTYWQDPPSARTVVRDGRRAVKLVIMRGNKGVEFHQPIPLDPARQHLLEAEALTRHLIKGGAALEVVFLDGRGQALETRRTRPVNSPIWTTIRLPLARVPDTARWIRLRCLLIGAGDVRGEAYFGPVNLIGSPRRSIRTPWASLGRFHPSRRLRPSQSLEDNVRLVVRVSGAKKGAYELSLNVWDRHGKVHKAQTSWKLERSFGTRHLDLTVRAPGFYTGRLQLRRAADDKTVFVEPFELAVYDDRFGRHGPALGPIGLALHDLNRADRLPQAVELIRPAWIRLALDRRQATSTSQGLLAIVRRLTDQQVRTIGMLHGKQLVPDLLAGKQAALDELVQALRNYGGHIRDWQLGDDASGPAWQDDSLRSKLLGRLPGLRRQANVAARFGLPDTSGGDFQVKAGLTGRASAGDMVVHRLPARPIGRWPGPGRLARLARRMIERKVDGVSALLLARVPAESWLAHDRAHPELLLARSVNGFIGNAPLLTRIDDDALVFSRRGRTVIVVYGTPRKPIELYPGRRAQAWDMFGNALLLGNKDNLNTKNVFRIMAPVRGEPYFITGVDTPFLRTQLSARFESAPLNSRIGEQKVALKMTNHFPDRRRLLIRLGFPDGFNASPREHSLVLEGGQSGTLTVPVRLGPLAYAGPVQVEMWAHVVKEEERRFFRRRLSLQVNSVLGVTAKRKGAGLLIAVTNSANVMLNVVVRVQLPTGLRESWAIGFPPNSTRTRELPVANAAALVGKQVEVNLRDTATGRFLRTRVVVQ